MQRCRIRKFEESHLNPPCRPSLGSGFVTSEKINFLGIRLGRNLFSWFFHGKSLLMFVLITIWVAVLVDESTWSLEIQKILQSCTGRWCRGSIWWGKRGSLTISIRNTFLQPPLPSPTPDSGKVQKKLFFFVKSSSNRVFSILHIQYT